MVVVALHINRRLDAKVVCRFSQSLADTPVCIARVMSIPSHER
jgi:hypothetical protein